MTGVQTCALPISLADTVGDVTSAAGRSVGRASASLTNPVGAAHGAAQEAIAAAGPGHPLHRRRQGLHVEGRRRGRQLKEFLGHVEEIAAVAVGHGAQGLASLGLQRRRPALRRLGPPQQLFQRRIGLTGFMGCQRALSKTLGGGLPLAAVATSGFMPTWKPFSERPALAAPARTAGIITCSM